MATRLQLRTSVRVRLEDTSGSPLWSDSDLNEYLAGAMLRYGGAVPVRSVQTAAVAAGATSLALPSLPSVRLERLRDGSGADVPPAGRLGEGPAYSLMVDQSWRVVGGSTVLLTRPVLSSEAGTWSLEVRAGRVLVADDVTTQPIEGGDEPVVVAFACSAAVGRRMVEDVKRGVRSTVGDAVAAFEREALSLLGRDRRVRSGAVVEA